MSAAFSRRRRPMGGSLRQQHCGREQLPVAGAVSASGAGRRQHVRRSASAKRFRQRARPEARLCLRITAISAVLPASMSAQFSRSAFAIRNSFSRRWTGCRRRIRRPPRRRSKIQSCGGQIVARGNTRPTVRIAIGDCHRRLAKNSQLVYRLFTSPSTTSLISLQQLMPDLYLTKIL